MEKLIEVINEISENVCNYADKIKMFVYAVATWYLATFSEVIPTFKIITAVFIAQILAGTFVGVNIKHDLLAVSDARGPSRFYFVTPENLIAEQELPPWAGLIIAHQGSRNVYLHTRRPAPQLHRIKLEDERFQSAMTTCYWRFLRLYLKT